MERSLGSGRYIFTEAIKQKGHISRTEYDILDAWYQWLISISPGIDEIIYLRSTPEVAFNRLKNRARDEESNIDLEYLQLLHELHERWLMDHSNSHPPVRVIDSNQPLEVAIANANRLAQDLTERIFPHLLIVQ
jgi:deoxynucleoside kinase